MKRLLIAAAFSLVVSEAMAISRYDISDMNCADVQAVVQTDGAAILSYPSTSILGLPVYDRYVQSQKDCPAGEVVRGAGVPTVDKKYCPVKKCVASSIFVSR